jgi:hypothetical protein
MTNDILPLFCDIDDFCQVFEPELKRRLFADGSKQRHRQATLCLSEVMTIIVWFHASAYRTFKDYYTREVLRHLRWAFPHLVSYSRFVELMPQALLPLSAYLQTRKGACSGISFVDSMPLVVCHNRRIKANKVFAGVARRGKTSVDWFYGFKLHLIANDCGELLGIHLTPGNVDDRLPVPQMAKHLFGKLFGDRGYISQKLFELLCGRGIQLITKIKVKMKNKLMLMMDKLMLRKRAIIESINDQLQNISQIEHSRHRSVVNFLVNVVAALIAYTHQEKKPSLNLRTRSLMCLPAVVL